MLENVEPATLAAEAGCRDELNIDRCGQCDLRVALRRPTPAHPASPWRCRRCQAVFLATPQMREGRRFSAGTRAAFYFDVMAQFALEPLAEPAEIAPRDVRRLRACLTRGLEEGPELRRHRRFPIAASVIVLPLSRDLQITDVIGSAQAINVSAGGMAIVNGRRIEEPFFAVDFSRANSTLVPVLLETVRTREVGEAFEIAGKFVSRIEY